MNRNRTRGPGRPRKADPDQKMVSIDQAVALSKEYWAKFDRPGYSKGTIYNMISEGKLRREGRWKGALLYEDEVRRKLCG